MKINFSQTIQFFKHLRVLALLEIFEKWFGFIVKLIWIGTFLVFGIYIYKEYKKNVFYLKDFKVPIVWAEKGYTGEVVREAVLDDIDKIIQEIAQQTGLSTNNRGIKSNRNSDNDNTQILSDINLEGFNLKGVVKTILSLLGKKDKNIGGYITLTDSSQTMAVQITGQAIREFSINRQQPIKNLVHDAALHIMRIRQPFSLLIYYLNKRDTIAVLETYDYLVKNREVIKDIDFYYVASNIFIFTRDFDKADIWADSLIQKYPNDIDSYWNKANLCFSILRFGDLNSAEKAKYNRLYEENLKKALIHNTSNGEEVPPANVYLQLSRYYFSQKNIKLGEEYAEKSNKSQPFGAYAYNVMGYAYIDANIYEKAEKSIKSAINIEPGNANFWDSLAEVYALQGNDSLSVVTLKKALNAPIKIGSVTVKAYRVDRRWQKLRKRKDFQDLLTE